MCRKQDDYSDEEIAGELAHLGVLLHDRGLLAPYRRIVSARNEILDILDEELRLRLKSSAKV